MFSILLAIIYVAFISLGLPDSLLGSAWPSMYGELGVSVSYAGIISAIIAAGTIVSSLLSDKLIRRLGTGFVTAISVAMTALALLGFSWSGAFLPLCLWAVPYGLGAGSVDAALNNFVALHYKSRHMSWLHCFWGVGATAGPSIMGLCLTRGLGWHAGYRTVGIIQAVLVLCLVISLPLWRVKQGGKAETAATATPRGIRGALALRGAKPVMVAFFCYCSLETTTGLWASSYLVLCRGFRAESAAMMGSIFFLGITAGRFVSGLIAGRLDGRRMVRLGQGLAGAGVLLLLLPLGGIAPQVALTLIGLGCAPIYPSLLHQTPENFGREQSQSVMGLQMACAYTGSTLTPLLFGFLADHLGTALYPGYLLFFVALMFAMTELAMRRIRAGRLEPV